MKLAEHTDFIRQKIDHAFRNKLGRMGITAAHIFPQEEISTEQVTERNRMLSVLDVFTQETGNKNEGYEKLVEELTFTLFNRIAALKVMEAHVLLPEVITRRSEHGDRSFAHLAWLEQNPQGRNEELEGLISFFESQLELLSQEIPLFSVYHPYHLLPTPIELLGIIQAFNTVEQDAQVEADIWKSDDVLGWLYESYNNEKKKKHKDSGSKTEYNKVSIQSQVYTPRWVVKFLVDNSLGKLYLEMFPDSEIKNRYKIANAPSSRTRSIKSLHEIKLIDPSSGSANFLLYSFDLFYDLYLDQIENYGADYDKRDIPKLIIEHNLHGVDLDDRAVQLAQLGLYIKAKRKKRNIRIEHFNVVSSDFFLPEYEAVKTIFEDSELVKERERKIIASIWEDLQQAYKFGSLLRLEETLHWKWFGKKDGIATLFDQQDLEDYETFRMHFFSNLNKAMAQNTAKQGQTFLNVKTQDAITFLQVMTQKYDVAVANPPYTDSADFGPELKKFVEENFKKPYKFNTNLYAAFIKRCFELTNEDGYIGMIHPHTFMFIKTFEDVRRFMIDKTHVDILVDYGLDRVNLFGPGILLDATWYVLSKKTKTTPGIYFNITDNQQEKAKQQSLEIAYEDFCRGRNNSRLFTLPQEKLKIIEGWPFIYWISDGFREKFKGESFDSVSDVKVGINSGSNEQYVRFWWEIDESHFSIDYVVDKKKWVGYAKGGPFNKWYGNLWLKLNWENDGEELRNCSKAILRNEEFYFKEGLTYSASGSKGVSFRYLPSNYIFDVGGSCVFPKESISNKTLLSILNSKLSFYIADCLNPTVNTQVGDLKRIPFVKPSTISEKIISNLADKNINLKKNLCSYRVTESNYINSPLNTFQGVALKDRVLAYLNFENTQLTEVLINEAIINELIFELYDLSDSDREQVEAKMGISIGSLPILTESRDAFLHQSENPLDEVVAHIHNLEITIFEDQKVREIKEEFANLYQSNNDLEEFCIRHQVNPINVWYWFQEANILPQGRAHDIALEFLADAIRTILREDEDGIIPLVGLPGESRLLDRLEEYCVKQGFSSAQFMQLDGLLGRPVNEYLEHHFFKNLSDHLNLFMYLPKTPFIWHLSSGTHQGFEAYIIIYKWTRDSLFRLKSQYINKRIESLEYRQLSLQNVNTAQAMNERELIIKQLDEIALFTKKIDELIEEGYDPILDSGVGKNIAPLQKKGMLRAEVLKDKQLEKYLKADW